jgi:hypothetical protein
MFLLFFFLAILSDTLMKFDPLAIKVPFAHKFAGTSAILTSEATF